MRWNKFTIKTKTEAEDLVIATLAEIGIEGVEIEDKVPLSESDKQQMFVDILPDGPKDDGIAYLNFYVEVKEEAPDACPSSVDAGDSIAAVSGQKDDGVRQLPQEIGAIIENVRRELEELRSFTDIGEGSITVSQTEDKDWINNWKEYFHQFYVDDILIIPSWEEVKAEDKEKMIIHIDPGTAFGTGMHETTQLCMRQLKKYVTNQTELLDVGTGSGILSIAALKLGARHAVGTDLDPCAISAVRENLEANDIPAEAMEMLLGNIIDDKTIQDTVGYEKYDIVAANILAEVLVPLTPVIVNHLKPGGIYITSGIIEEKETVVVEAVKAAGLDVLEVTHQNDWVSVTARKA
ncbi:MAG: 50S ribosomal protein L11 methyltransferase [Lachnospiraceae bacterium]|nr:50S ribosomal protein L11 methyltransferase [Lachnospiraceae bacterium]